MHDSSQLLSVGITLAWMERRILRKRVSDDEEDESLVEVDNISFTSLASSDDGDLHMSVQQSPAFSNYSEFKSASELSLHCRPRSISENDSSSYVPPTAQAAELSRDSLSSGSGDHEEATLTIEEPSLIAEQETSSEPFADESTTANVFDCSWVDSLYFTALAPAPQIVQRPYWESMEEELRQLRLQDSNVSKDLEESNIYMYSLQLSLCAMEEARWFNEMSKDPELSKLINEIDPKFPLAVNHLPGEGDCSDSLTSFIPAAEGDDKAVSADPGPSSQVSSFFRGRRPRYPRHANGSSKESSSSWTDLSVVALESFVETEQIRDPRVAKWVEKLIQRAETMMSLPSTSHDDKSKSDDHGSEPVAERFSPVHEEWIFSLSKSESIKTILEAQNNRCAGCGIRIEKEYMKRVKYCDYYGKVFCQCCHQGSKYIIPARILHTWNFNEFPVSDIAFHFLNEIHDVPAINVCSVAPHIVEKIRVLKHVIVLREKLSYMWDYIKDCSDAEETVTKCGNLKTLFTSLEQHLLHSVDLFSLSDLTRVHNKDMSSLLEPIAYYAKCHIEACEHCKQYATTCVFCGNVEEPLFPFQLEKVHKCSTCGSLSHMKCQAKFRKKTSGEKGCKRCHKASKDKS
ncbi:unnamed protein product [Cylicocyclus nassatus]|uniref:Rubicon Homology domain-containing protein n=1 Tax=Cylicocyclus nassatus TaxID=53992 RepID=A0AA36MAD1_CYLNA|nr:unnamed protein product [Cylicocyclus nassatus]